MSIEQNKNLVKQGHELAVLLGTQHGMLDAASLVQRLTAQLDVTTVAMREMTKQRDALAAESAAQKNWRPNPHCASMFEAIEKAQQLMDEGMPESAMLEAFEILKMKRTPATDAFLAEMRADAILFASYQLPDDGKYQDCLQTLSQEVRDGDTQVSFPVKQLRKGGAA